MPKINLPKAVRIKTSAGEVTRLKGPGFSWTKPTPAPTDNSFAPSLVRVATGFGGGTNAVLSMSSVGCSHLLIQASRDNSGPEMTPTSNRGGTFVEVDRYTTTDGTYTTRTVQWMHTGFTENAVHTITIADGVYSVVSAAGLNSNGRPILVDQKTVAAARTDSPYVSNPLTRTKPNSLVVASFTPINYGGGGDTVTVDTPFGNIAGSPDGAYWQGIMAFAVVTGSTAAISATFRNTVNPANNGSVKMMNLYCENP